MKNIIYIGAAILAAYAIKKGYDFYKSGTTLDLEVTDIDLINFKFKIRFINAGNSDIKIDSCLNTIYLNNNKIGTAKNLNGFTIRAKSESEVSFDIQTSILTGALSILSTLKNKDKNTIIKIDSVINASGLIINKTTTI